jgi:hypothetical protein
MEDSDKQAISMMSVQLKELFLNLSIYPDVWSEALAKFLRRENPWGEGVLLALHNAGWTPEELAILQKDHASLVRFRSQMFPTPIIDADIRDVVTVEALEDARIGSGTVQKALLRKLREEGVGSLREMAILPERRAVRVIGRKDSKTYRAGLALLAKHNLCFGMKFS